MLQLHKRQLYEQELVELIRLFGPRNKQVSSAQNAIAGLMCTACLRDFHQRRPKRGRGGVREFVHTSKTPTKSSRSGMNPFATAFDPRSNSRTALVIITKDGRGLSVCTECAPQREELYDRAVCTRRQLQGPEGCLVGTSLFHWGKLKQNLHELNHHMGKASDELGLALDFFQEAIELRQKAFKDFEGLGGSCTRLVQVCGIQCHGSHLLL